ncbi:hypothetical protein [Caulobacter segnis]
MAYTAKQLTMAWTAVQNGLEPDAATLAQLQLRTNASFSDKDALAYVLNSADGTTALAVLSYQFFTGKSPTKAGMDYLVNSPTNTTDLNDPYYARFGLENRYINFAANLGVAGEGAAAFAAKYGAMSFGAYVASIYETIIGATYATAAGLDAAKAIADITSRQAAILATAKSAGMITPNMTQAQIDLAVKAATAGYLLGEAIKADVGLYAAAANNFMLAVAKGTAVYNVDITTTYKPVPGSGAQGAGHTVDVAPDPAAMPGAPPSEPTGRTLTLTAGAGGVVGSSGDDTFNAGAGTIDVTDVIDGGDGYDTLNITSTAGGTFSVPNATIRNVEAINISNTDRLSLSVGGWTDVQKFTLSGTQAIATGLGNADVTANISLGNLTMVGGHNVTLNVTNGGAGNTNWGSITGTAVVNWNTATGGNTPAGITIGGGTSVNITQTTSNAVNTTAKTSPVTVHGSALTTTVTVKAPQAVTADATHAGVILNSVTIHDVNKLSATDLGTITSIDVDGYTTLTIYDSALSTLKVAHGSGNIAIDNGNIVPAVVTTLNMSVNGLTGGTLSDSGLYTTLNITTGAEASTMGLNMGGLTALNVGGAGSLSLNAINATNPLQTITVTGSASFDAFPMSGVTALTTLNGAATSGVITGNIDPSRTVVSTGSGADTLTLTGATVSKAISLGAGNDMLILASGTTALGATLDGGAGTADMLVMRAVDAVTASGSAAFGAQVTGFERLQITGASNQTVDIGALGFNDVLVSLGGGAGLTLNGLSSGGTVTLSGAGTAYTIGSGNFGGAGDVLNLKLSNPTGATQAYATTGITAAGVETINITVDDARTTPTGTFKDSVTLLGNDAKTVTVGGDAGLTLTATSTALTSVDASGITLGDFTWTSGALAGAATIKGSATGANDVTFSAATGGIITYEGGSGADTLDASNGLAGNVIHLGGGANYFVGHGGGTSAITAGSGDDYIRVLNGGATIQAGNGGNVVIALDNLASTITTGTGNDNIFVGGGANTVDVGSGTDFVGISAATATATAYTTITGMGAGDEIEFSNVTFTQLGAGAAVANLAAATAGDGSTVPVLSWFVAGGDTFVVVDLSVSANFVNGVDYIVKLTGVHNLSSASNMTAHTVTLLA